MVGSFTGVVSFGSTTLTSSGGSDAFVAKWSMASNSFVWAYRMGGTMADGAVAVAVNGISVYIAGSFSDTALFGAGTADECWGTDAFVAKLTDVGLAQLCWLQHPRVPMSRHSLP